MRIIDWSSDVCSSDLQPGLGGGIIGLTGIAGDADDGGDADDSAAAPPHHAPQRGTRQTEPGGQIEVDDRLPVQIGRASCRERVCQYVESSVVDGQIKKK